MKRRSRLAVTLLTLAVHLLAPIGAYAAPRPGLASSDFCSALTPADGVLGRLRAAQVPGTPAQHPRHPQHSHCPSCLGMSVALATAPPAEPFFVAPLALSGASGDPARTIVAAHPTLLPPLRGPPAIPL
jgi:cytochrome c biogenesis protein CcdA